MKVRINCASGLRKQRPDAFVGFRCARSTGICAPRFGLYAETHLRELAREHVTQVAIPDPCGCVRAPAALQASDLQLRGIRAKLTPHMQALSFERESRERRSTVAVSPGLSFIRGGKNRMQRLSTSVGEGPCSI